MTGFRSILEEQARSFPSLDFDLFSMRLPREFADLGDNLFSAPREWLKSKDFTVGRNAYARGLRAEHPVVLLPGVISTGLESWTTDEISAGFFRKRLWGSATMMRTIVFEKERWIRHISLDPDTGLDPPGIKVRASEGFDGASHFIAGYWIWAKIIENLAVLGYDINNLWLAAYDWRLSYHNLEVRDRFFTRMKLRIEQNKRIEGKKTVLVAHSMGSSVALHFFKWVEAEGEGYGNGGPSWVEDHIEAFTSIAGTFLGVPKAMAALLSGEMRDTVELPPAAAYLLEKFFSRSERAKLFQSWAGSASMMIKGGSAIWGNASFAADDEWNSTDTHGNIYSFKLPALEHQMGAADSGKASHEQAEASHHDPSALSSAPQNLTAGDAITWLMQHTPTSFQRMLAANYSNGMEYDPNVVRENAKKEHEQTWSNPLEAPLPNAPSMKIHCLYGVGKSTERSYWYEQGPYQRDETESEGDNAQCAANDDCTVVTPLDFPTGRTGWIDASIHDEKANPVVRAGCKMGDGDGTVSLLSLGAMCVEGWKRERYNPAGIKVITHEVKHMPAAMDPRGGLTTADHVDILGSYAANDVVLRVAAGQGSDVPENFESKIREFAARIDWDNPPASSQQSET
ncbi:phospholipid:diacylglycerol acyltransferase [Ceraceosorus bombacis]|uniref:Phospholipid:diacylglycerol acyltransferase n=1 Tax=Ceraceosorus bombacis TaxID=401625 RepID=A0A0P1BPK0_9BASI|nr:phospholipid:diacylglycerol acyltransferase [Ceraceosorus bombacis]